MEGPVPLSSGIQRDLRRVWCLSQPRPSGATRRWFFPSLYEVLWSPLCAQSSDAADLRAKQEPLLSAPPPCPAVACTSPCVHPARRCFVPPSGISSPPSFWFFCRAPSRLDVEAPGWVPVTLDFSPPLFVTVRLVWETAVCSPVCFKSPAPPNTLPRKTQNA